jgi:hypothetical protein
VGVQRFTKNTFFVEKNPTIVNFPISGVDLGELMTPEARAKQKSTTYDLLANIVHDGGPKGGTYRVHIQHKVPIWLDQIVKRTAPYLNELTNFLLWYLFIVYVPCFFAGNGEVV